MKKHIFAFIGLLTLSTGFALGFTDSTASAKAVKVPSSLRGTWYHYDPSYGSYEKLTATTYHFKISGINGTSSYSGVKFPSYANGHADMYVSKTPKGYYRIGKYGTDDEGMWKRVNHKGHPAIKQPWHEIPDTGTYVDYWYKTKAIAKHPSVKYKASKFNGYYYDKYTPAYLQADEGPQKLYTSASDANSKSGHYITVKSIYKKYYAKWDSESNDVIRIRVNGKTYYQKDNSGFQSFNSWKDGNRISSPYSPTSRSKIVMRHGDKYSKSKYWDKVEHYKTGVLILKSWKFTNSGWVKDR